jgi:DNA-binding MarR family transcriptional regulator
VSTDVAGLLGLALDEATGYLNGQVAPRHPELRQAHLRLFRAGSPDGRRVTELAARTRMTKQAMHELVVHLERLGYLRRSPDPADVRARLVTLTARGRELEAEVAAASARLHARWRDTLGEELFTAMETALARLTASHRQP